MRIAVACDGLRISPFFVQCSSYMCYTIENNIPVSCRNTPALDQPLEKLPEFFHTIDASVLITCKIDDEITTNLEAHGITVVSDAKGDPLTAVRKHLATKNSE